MVFNISIPSIYIWLGSPIMVEWHKLEKIDDFSSISSKPFENNNWTDGIFDTFRASKIEYSYRAQAIGAKRNPSAQLRLRWIKLIAWNTLWVWLIFKLISEFLTWRRRALFILSKVVRCFAWIEIDPSKFRLGPCNTRIFIGIKTGQKWPSKTLNLRSPFTEGEGKFTILSKIRLICIN